jgi:hypothetical protein
MVAYSDITRGFGVTSGYAVICQELENPTPTTLNERIGDFALNLRFHSLWRRPQATRARLKSGLSLALAYGELLIEPIQRSLVEQRSILHLAMIACALCGRESQ